MKKFFLIFAIALTAIAVHAANPAAGIAAATAAANPAMNIHLTTGETQQVALARVDSLYFDASATTLYAVVDGTPYAYFITVLDSISFSDQETTIRVQYNGTKATVFNPFAFDGVSTTFDGTDITLKSTVSVVLPYEVSGTSSDGSLKINSKNAAVQVTLSSLTLTSSGNVINVKNASATFHGQGTNKLTVTGKDAAALKAEGALCWADGNVTIVTTGAGDKALKADGNVRLAGGSLTITQSGDTIMEDGDPTASTALRSNASIFVSGGSLTLTSSAKSGRGINADGHITISGGTINMTLSGAGYSYTNTSNQSDTYCACGIKADSTVSLLSGTITITTTSACSGGKGINSTGALTIGNASGGPTLTVTTAGSTQSSSSSGGSWWAPASSTAGPGGGPGGGGPGGGGTQPGSSSSGGKAKAIRCEGDITVNNGTVMVQTSTSGAEGIESKNATTSSIVFNGGTVLVKAYDDGINSAGVIRFNGANVVVYSNGNDAVDSNYGKSGAITIAGGNVAAFSSSGSPEEAFDCDQSSYMVITGGTAVGFGGQQGGGSSWGTSSNSIGSSSQGYALISGSVSYATGKYYTLYDASSNALISWQVPATISSALSLYTAQGLAKSKTCTVKSSTSAPSGATTVGSSATGSIYLGGTSSASTSVTSFTTK